MKVAVFTDVHANLPALDAALAAILDAGCELIVCLGDTISIGPSPAETVERLLESERLLILAGNHDALYVRGLPTPPPAYMRPPVVAHHRWTHAQLDRRPQLRRAMAMWPGSMTLDLAGTWTTFLHYQRDDSERRLAPITAGLDAEALDDLFGAQVVTASELLFYGHDHRAVDVCGRARYINPGSLGCAPQAIARFVIAHVGERGVEVEAWAVDYDDAPLREAFVSREVPNREQLDRNFYGSRLGLDEKHP